MSGRTDPVFAECQAELIEQQPALDVEACWSVYALRFKITPRTDVAISNGVTRRSPGRTTPRRSELKSPGDAVLFSEVE